MKLSLVLLSAAITFACLAGCIVDKERDSRQFSVPTVDDLLYVGGSVTMASATTFGSAERSFVFGYQGTGPHTLKETRIGTSGMVTSNHTIIGNLAFIPSLNLSYGPSSASVKQLLGDLQAVLPTNLVNGDKISFWLSGMGGTVLWIENIARTGGIFERVAVNFASSTAITLAPSIPPLSTPSPAVPDFGMKEFVTVADAAASLWAADAVAISISTVETPSLEVVVAPAGRGETTSRFLALPDLQPGDGKAMQWFFFYYSPSKNLVLPEVVYASAVVVQGDALAPTYAASTYHGLNVHGNFVDSTALPPHLNVHYRAFYALDHAGPNRVEWTLEWNGNPADFTAYLIVNGNSGQVLACAPHTWCM